MLGGVGLWDREGRAVLGSLGMTGGVGAWVSREVLGYLGWVSLGSLMKLFWPIMVFQPSLQSMHKHRRSFVSNTKKQKRGTITLEHVQGAL
jgi:hypothetical protein